MKLGYGSPGEMQAARTFSALVCSNAVPELRNKAPLRSFIHHVPEGQINDYLWSCRLGMRKFMSQL
jgi:hypothetical protein